MAEFSFPEEVTKDNIELLTERAESIHEKAVARYLQRTEVQRIQRCDRSRTHGEDVTHYPSDARGRSLVRLYRAGVVVRLNFKSHCQSLTYIYQTGILLASLS